jgi:hypothetical protein
MIKKETLSQLRSHGSPNSVSIYIPTDLTGDYQANRIRWKNACNEALSSLEAKGVEKTSFLKPAMDLIDNMDFWAHQSAGLAGFYAENHHSHHHLLHKIDSLTIVDDTFHLSHLLQDIINEDRIFVLAMSQQEVRFFEAVNSGIYPVKIADVVPPNMEVALNLDIDGNSLQSHSAGGGLQYHGNDSGQDKENIRLQQYFRTVDEGLLKFIHDEKVPLVLAAVEEYYPVYEEITAYKYFSPHMITGNPENLSPAEIRKQLDPVFKEFHEQRVNTFVDDYNSKSQQNMTIDGISQISEYAKNKNIDSMLVCQNYWDSMSKDDKKTFDDLLFSVYDQGGNIIITNTEHHDCETLHAIRRY